MRRIFELAQGRIVMISLWQVALLAIVVSGIYKLIALKSSENSQYLYGKELKKAPWSLPGWMFGPAWITNNFFLLLALLGTVNMENGTTRTSLLNLQVFIWFIFYTFDFIYFNRKSPILGTIWMKSDSVLSLASFFLAWRLDRNLAYCYVPLVLWSVYAGTVADYQAFYNWDPVFKTKPLLEFIHREKGKKKKKGGFFRSGST